MVRLCVLSDAHLLYQAEWIDDEAILRGEVTEVLDNFERAMSTLEKESPEAIVMAGDMFDSKTASGQRVAHREGEKYMSRIREILLRTAKKAGCKIYALRGNHDSEPVLKSLESTMNGVFIYARKRRIQVGDLEIALMDTHYLTGSYEIPLDGIPEKADLLFIHESVPLANV